MMVRKIKIAILTILFLAGYIRTSEAQDVMFSQFYSNPLYLNPALAGSSVCPRISLGGRAQWLNVPNAYNSIFASYDQYASSVHGGIGVLVIGDQSGDGILNSYRASAMYSYRLKIAKDLHVNFALEAALQNTYIDQSVIILPNDIGSPTSSYPLGNSSTLVPDFSAGMVAYSDIWYGGLAFAHLTQPNVGFKGESKLPLKTTVHIGARLNTEENRRRTSPLGIATPVVSPNIIFQNQGAFNYFSYGVYLDWLPIATGVWFRHTLRNADAFIFLLGYHGEKFQIGYSYDLTVSQLSNAGGGHELTLGWKLACPEKKKKIKKINCPTF